MSGIRSAVRILHDPLSSGVSRRDANAWLHTLDSDATGDGGGKGEDSNKVSSSNIREKLPTRVVLSACVGLLRGEENVGFFAANVMYSKIRREWGALKDEERGYLRQRIDAEVKMEVEGRKSPDGVIDIRTLQRLCLCTAAMSVLARSGSNTRTITETVKEAEWMLSAVKAVMGAGGDPTKPLVVFAELLTRLPEEYEHNLEVLSADRQTELREEFMEVAPSTMELVRQMLITAGSVSDEIASRGLECIGRWAGVGGITLPKTFEAGKSDSILRMLLGAFSASVTSLSPKLLVASSQALASVLGVQQYPTWYGSSPQAQQAFGLCIDHVLKSWPILAHCAANPYESSSEDAAHALCKVAVALGEYQTENARFPFGRMPTTRMRAAQLLQAAQSLLRLATLTCSWSSILKCAEFPIRLVARTTIDFWLSLQDIPMNQRHPELRRPLYANLLLLMARQCALPADTESLDDVEYDLESFRDSTDGVRDLLVSTWYVLKESYFEMLMQNLNGVPAEQIGASWPVLESAFFTMHAVSRDVKAHMIEAADKSTTPRAGTASCPVNRDDDDVPLALRPQQRCLFNLITQLASQGGSNLLSAHPLVQPHQTCGSYASVLSLVGHTKRGAGCAGQKRLAYPCARDAAAQPYQRRVWRQRLYQPSAARAQRTLRAFPMWCRR